MQVDIWCTRWNGQARGVAMHATEACGQPCVRWGVDLHALQSCSRPSGRGCVILHETEACSQSCGARGGTAKHKVSRCMRPGHAARHVEDVVSACMTSGARGAAAHASGAMRNDTRAATRLAPDCTWRRFCSSEERSVLVETSSSGDQSRRGSTCEGRERVRNAEVGFGVKATVNQKLTWWQDLDSVCVKGSRRCCSTCNLYMQVDMWSTRWNGQARRVAMHVTEACGQPCVRWGVDLHALQ
ncbi:hypothetical protein F2Q68_00004324 [Brassica cretica]|uniref:Uncharacterized protein n=1 Tax=Brassica cretica TaxID=69181 RepID=A0A8S9JAC4_BRACR|nr:hypothetical protein F2Q68_00004324 [Brassica cretica]